MSGDGNLASQIGSADWGHINIFGEILPHHYSTVLYIVLYMFHSLYKVGEGGVIFRMCVLLPVCRPVFHIDYNQARYHLTHECLT